MKTLETQLKELQGAVAVQKERIEELQKTKTKHNILTEAQVLELLGIGEKTLRSYRTNRLLAYSKIGNKFFYLMSDIEAMIINARFEAY